MAIKRVRGTHLPLTVANTQPTQFPKWYGVHLRASETKRRIINIS